jgi:hypothetical protein
MRAVVCVVVDRDSVGQNQGWQTEIGIQNKVSKNAPSFSELIRPTTKDYDDRRLLTIVRRILGNVFCSLFLGIGIALLFAKPLSVLTCRHVEPKQTDCQLEKRIAWVIPVQKIPIVGLEKAIASRTLVTGTDEDGEPSSYYIHEVILVGDSGEIGFADADESLSLSSDWTARRINDYLSTPTDEPLTIWGYGLWIHTLSTVCFGTVFLASAFVFAICTVNSTPLYGAWTIEFILFVVGWVMDKAGLLPGVRRQITRLGQCVRGIAIQPDDNDSVQTGDPRNS